MENRAGRYVKEMRFVRGIVNFSLNAGKPRERDSWWGAANFGGAEAKLASFSIFKVSFPDTASYAPTPLLSFAFVSVKGRQHMQRDWNLIHVPRSFIFVFHLQLVELEFERHVFGAVGAVVVRETAAGDLHVLAHIDAPGVV